MIIHDHAAALVRDIEKGFDAVPYPGDAEIESDHCLECQERADFYRGKDWKRVRAGDNVDASTLSFLSPKAFHAYIPCFLIPALAIKHYQDHVSESVPNVTDAVLSTLSAPGDRLRDFTGAQLALLRRWVEFIRDEAYPWEQESDARIEAGLDHLRSLPG